MFGTNLASIEDYIQIFNFICVLELVKTFVVVGGGAIRTKFSALVQTFAINFKLGKIELVYKTSAFYSYYNYAFAFSFMHSLMKTIWFVSIFLSQLG